VELDTLRDPDGHGWNLNRARFAASLRAAAVARGSQLLAPAYLAAIARWDDGWNLRLDYVGGSLDLRARFLIDADGRASPLRTQLGARRILRDKLVCG
jgi:2-polyprenyl-6-methoxyphenol hydroxylase-like FAD-dependent oxidoreductase